MIPSGGALPYTYLWNTGQTTANISELPQGTYTVTITDNNDCTIEDAVLLLSPPDFEATYSITPPSCFGENDGLLAIEITGMSSPYTYSLDGNNQTNSTFLLLESGWYDLIISDANQCNWEETIYIDEPAEIIVDITPEDIELQLGDSIRLNPSTNATLASVQWIPPIGLSCDTCLNTISKPLETTNYQLSVLDTSGCAVTKEVAVIIKNDKPVYLPNAFSPNGDGNNDVLMVYAGTGIEKVNLFSVFNRWGKVVFTATDFLPNDPDFGWGANQNNEPDGVGVYVYYVEVRYINGTTEIFKGDVLLIR